MSKREHFVAMSALVMLSLLCIYTAWVFKAAPVHAQQVQSFSPQIMTGTTGSIGGGALLAGACTSGTATVTGATTGMLAVAQSSDGTNIQGLGVDVSAVVTSANTVTVNVCVLLALTPAAKTYNVRVIP